jgi:hypothetical protein
MMLLIAIVRESETLTATGAARISRSEAERWIEGRFPREAMRSDAELIEDFTAWLRKSPVVVSGRPVIHGKLTGVEASIERGDIVLKVVHVAG